jgi:hypothetical protein
LKVIKCWADIKDHVLFGGFSAKDGRLPSSGGRHLASVFLTVKTNLPVAQEAAMKAKLTNPTADQLKVDINPKTSLATVPFLANPNGKKGKKGEEPVSRHCMSGACLFLIERNTQFASKKTLFMNSAQIEGFPAYAGPLWSQDTVETACKAALTASFAKGDNKVFVEGAFVVQGISGENICMRLNGNGDRLTSCFPNSIEPTQVAAGKEC